ncbi:hypothetical protein F5Y03DRAFT_403625 [Xylaria venustula]|nr:hypothetical protein F5Y03DRAFT_403625 [Xylaria venustula]
MPSTLINRRPEIEPLLGELNRFYNQGDGPGQPSQLYDELLAAWWPLARAKYYENREATEQVNSDCRIWPAFFEKYILSDRIDVLGYAIFSPMLGKISEMADRKTRFNRVVHLLKQQPWQTLLWLGPDVSMKTNSLKHISALLGSPKEAQLKPNELLAQIYEEMLVRHNNDHTVAPSPTSADVTTIYNRYRRKAPSRAPSAVPSMISAPVTATAALAERRKRAAEDPVPELEPEPKRQKRSHTRRTDREDDEGHDDEDGEGDEEMEEPENGRSCRSPLLDVELELSSNENDSALLPSSSSSSSSSNFDLSSTAAAAAAADLTTLGSSTNSTTVEEAEQRRMLARLVAGSATPSAEDVGAARAGFWAVFKHMAQNLLDTDNV